MPKATPEEVALARQRRQEGETITSIAKELGRSIDWAWKATMDIKKGKIRTRTVTVFKNATWIPEDPELRRRVMNLAKRGFDVPPSKQADWDALSKAGYTVAERKQTLGLE